MVRTSSRPTYVPPRPGKAASEPGAPRRVPKSAASAASSRTTTMYDRDAESDAGSSQSSETVGRAPGRRRSKDSAPSSKGAGRPQGGQPVADALLLERELASLPTLGKYSAGYATGHGGGSAAISRWAESVYSATSKSSAKGSGRSLPPTATRSEKTSSTTPLLAPTRLPVADFNRELRQVNREITASLGTWRGNAARILTGLGALGSVGGALAMGLAAPAALTGLLTGVGVPHGFAAAILGVGVGLVGLGISVLAGSLVRSLTRRTVWKDPEVSSKLLVLGQMERYLSDKAKTGRLDRGDAALLKNTRAVLRKVDSKFTTSFKKQVGNALATPFTLLHSSLNGLSQLGRPPQNAKEEPLLHVKKSLEGDGLYASFGKSHVLGSDVAASEEESMGQRWLEMLRRPPKEVHD